jgi:DNA primase
VTHDIELLKRQNPIERVVTSYGVALRRSGTHLVGRCPFHRDTRPSLVVYPDTRSFFCFGCRAGGDVIDFVRRACGLSFREAVERLNGGRIRRSDRPGTGEQPSPNDQVVLTAACDVYHTALLRSQRAQRYLADRGIDLEVARRCRVGYGDGTALRAYLERSRLGFRQARDLGLVGARGVETMTGRLVVPELRGGQCIWLVGRALSDRYPKYWGVARPKPILGTERVQGRSHVILTEGPFDYLTGVRWGLPIAALIGTYVRPERLAVLAAAQRVVLALDTDPPGRIAATELATRLGDRAQVLHLPGGVKDLNELGQRADGRARFLQLLHTVEPDERVWRVGDGARDQAEGGEHALGTG